MKTTRTASSRRVRQHLLQTASVSAMVALAVRGGLAHSQAAPAQLATSAGDGLQEIVVTATRRNESIQDVPMTIQAFTGATLHEFNATSLNDLLKFTPNVAVSTNGPGQGNIYMRGLGSNLRISTEMGSIGFFPNVALYLNDEPMDLPSRNVDIYMVDMQRVEVLEGPQGTLFGGGAEAGAMRYITNMPEYNVFEGRAEGQYGFTSHGDPNSGANLTVNIPLVEDELAARIVIYDDRQGGYIDNVRSTFTRSNLDLGNYYFNIKPGATGLCPNGSPPGSAGCTLPNAPQINNYSVAANHQNPTTYSGARFSLKGQIADDWSALIVQSLSDLDVEGVSYEYPIGADLQQPLQPLQANVFVPAFDHDRWESTAWTIEGKISDLNLVYTGSYLYRHVSQQMDYTTGSRRGHSMYYQCTGGSTPWDTGAPPNCYSPTQYWQESLRNTHLNQEVRLSTPTTWRLRALGGAFYEDDNIYEVANLNAKTIPDCTSTNLAAALAGGPPCVADVGPPPGVTSNDPSVRGANTNFGLDTNRGYTQTALYASLDYDIVPQVLTVTAGSRWYRYNEFLKGSQYSTNGKCLNVPNGQCPGSTINFGAEHLNATYTGVVSRANMTWHASRDVMAYFTYSQGYRPGGLNRSSSKILNDSNGKPQYITPLTYAPDRLTNYEIGMKSELLQQRLILNLSAYYMKWSNIQQTLFMGQIFGQVTTNGVNGADYDIKGLEAQFVGRPLHGVTLQGAASYNLARQANSPCLIDNAPNSASFGQCITSAVPTGSSTTSPVFNPFGQVGSTLPDAPRLQGNFHIRYDLDEGGYLPWVSAGANYTGSMYNEPAGYPLGDGVLLSTQQFLRYRQPGYYTLDASAGVAKGNWTVGIYGSNLNNSDASTSTSYLQYIKEEVPLRPRTVALRVSATF
jgi:iron complex outermembrane receptor protein